MNNTMETNTIQNGEPHRQTDATGFFGLNRPRSKSA